MVMKLTTSQIKKLNLNCILLLKHHLLYLNVITKIKEVGFDDYISKPINKNDLFEWIRKFP